MRLRTSHWFDFKLIDRFLEGESFHHGTKRAGQADNSTRPVLGPKQSYSHSSSALNVLLGKEFL